MAIVDPFEQQGSVTVTGATGIIDPFESGATVDTTPKDKMSTYNYIANQAKLGLTDTAVIGQALIDTFVIEPVKSLVGPATPGGMGERFSKNIKRLQSAAGTLTGAQEETKAPSAVAEVLGGGARMLSDPVGYLGTGLFKIGKEAVQQVAGKVAGDSGLIEIGKSVLTEAGKTIAQAVPRAAGLFGLGVTTQTGGILGEMAEKQLGSDTGTGRALGTVAGLVTGIKTSAGIETVTNATMNMAKQLKSKYDMVKADPDGASQAYASGAAKRFLDIVAKGTPSENIDEIVDTFNKIGSKIGLEGVPLLVSLSDNPMARGEVIRLVKSSEGAGVRQQFNTEIDYMLGKLDSAFTDIAGSRYTPVQGISTPLTKEINKNIKLREAVDTKIEQIAERFPEQNLSELGEQATKLLGLREAAATKEMQPVYKSILEGAKKAGALLPDTGVRDIHSFVVANNMSDIFGRKTPLDKLITENFAPVKGDYYPATFEAVDSLKKEINRIQRAVKMDDTAKMRLGELENVVDVARQQIPGKWNQALVDADKAYYEKVGIPFNSQGIKDIDAKKYADQVAPQLIGSGDKLRPFLKAAGDEGITIAQNALMAEAYSKVIKNGALDARALQTFIKNKTDNGVLAQLPGSDEMLRAALFDDSALKIARADLDEKVKISEKQLADNFVLSVKDSDGMAVPNYEQIANRVFSDPNFLNKIDKDLAQLDKKTSKAVMRNIQAQVIDKARNATDGGVAFLTSSKNKYAMDKIFGSGYQQEIKDLMIMSDALNKADLSKVSSVVDQKNLDVLGQYAPGLDIPYVASALRDRISSTTQKAVRIISKAKSAQLKTDTDLAIKQLMGDRQGLKKLQAIKNTMDFKLRSPTSLKQIGDTISEVVPRYMYGGAKETIFTPPTAPLEDTTPEFGSFQPQ